MRCLSIHRDYACRHAGACCTAGWPIPIEADRLARVRTALETKQLRTAAKAAGVDPFVDIDQASEAPALITVFEHACIFYDREAAAHCRIHAALGHDALPLACRQFPRVTVHDPRGVSITLSHYCPTAASMLQRDEPTWIVDTPPAFPATSEYVGLDARDALPPLLRTDMLMDWESWWVLEALAVDLLANSSDDAATALTVLGDVVDRIAGWRPADGPLLHRVRASFSEARSLARAPGMTPGDVIAAIPEDLRSDVPVPSRGRVSNHVHKRFLAAHAFANWSIHLGPGVRAWYRSIEAAHCLIAAGYNIRQADLMLRHLADPNAVAKMFSGADPSSQLK